MRNINPILLACAFAAPFIIFLLVLFIGCAQKPVPIVPSVTNTDYIIIQLDGCEYIENTHTNTSITHKGNCKNHKK